MKAKTGIIIGAVVIVAGIGAALLLRKKAAPASPTNPTISKAGNNKLAVDTGTGKTVTIHVPPGFMDLAGLNP